jgi:ATP-dependent Clp protease adaptor protein ClpS
MSTAAPVEVKEPEASDVTDLARPWKVIVWNMMDVHTKGKAVVASGPREKSELDVFRLHEHGLWATMEQDS